MKHLAMKGLNHYKVKPYAYISIHDPVIDLHFELTRMTLDPFTVLWTNLPQYRLKYTHYSVTLFIRTFS